MTMSDDDKQDMRMQLGNQTMALSDLMTEDDVIEAVMDLKRSVHTIARVIIERQTIETEAIPSIIVSIVVDELIRPTLRQ